MFTFPATDYKWCSQCAGNIRIDATYCRFCKKPLKNKLLQEAGFKPFMTIDAVSQWMPQFNTMITKISDDLRTRFEQADIDDPAPEFGVPDGLTPQEYRVQNREGQSCLIELPEPQELGLLYDMMLSMYEKGEPIKELCDHPHFQLLELTPQEVIAELELRKEEIAKNHKCGFCAEYIFPDDDECRFCEGRTGQPPKATDSILEKTVDKRFLKDVILYEAAERIISGTTLLSKEILDANGITQDNIDQEILRLRGTDAMRPLTRFCKRMHDLGINKEGFFTPDTLSISELVDLGSALDSKKYSRSDEALIVYEHALKRTEGDEERIHERGRILDYISFYYQGKEDYVQYKKYHDLAKECQEFGLPDDMKALMDMSDLDTFEMLENDDAFDEDPEKRLANLNKRMSQSSDLLDRMISNASNAAPGLGEAFAAMGSAVDNRIDETRKTLEAEVAKKRGDYAEAEKKYAEALQLCGTGIGSSNRSTILISLAEIKHLQGDDTTAEATFAEALSNATEYAEIMPLMGDMCVWKCHLAIAKFQLDKEKYVESEDSFKLALQLQEQFVNGMMEKYGGDREEYSGEDANIKEPYAKLLRILNRNDEAEKLEIEVQQLRKETEQITLKRKEHRAKIAEQMLGDRDED